MIEILEFNRRLKHNVAMLKKQINENKFCANDYHFFDHKKNESNFLISRKFFDIIAATIIGALPVDKNSGIDCYRYSETRGFEALEVKLLELHTRGIFKTDSGGLYYGKVPTLSKNNRQAIRSTFAATFEICSNNLKAKNIQTAVVLFDTENHQIVDAIEMDGKDILHFLTHVVDISGNILERKTSRNRRISVGTFLKYGKKIKTKIPVVGFENWENGIKVIDMPIVYYKKKITKKKQK